MLRSQTPCSWRAVQSSQRAKMSPSLWRISRPQSQQCQIFRQMCSSSSALSHVHSIGCASMVDSVSSMLRLRCARSGSTPHRVGGYIRSLITPTPLLSVRWDLLIRLGYSRRWLFACDAASFALSPGFAPRLWIQVSRRFPSPSNRCRPDLQALLTQAALCAHNQWPLSAYKSHGVNVGEGSSREGRPNSITCGEDSARGEWL